MDFNEKLTERNKELECLYNTDLLCVQSLSIEEFLTKIIPIIQKGFRFVGFVNIEISYNESNYFSPYFSASKNYLETEILTNNSSHGFIRVYYKSDDSIKAFFLEEEKRLIFSIGIRVSDFLYKEEINQRKVQSESESNPNEIRNLIIKKMCKSIDLKEYGILAIYLIGSTKNQNAAAKSDIDLIIHFDGSLQSELKINSWFSAYNDFIYNFINEINNEGIKEIFDIHLISDQDIERKTSYATMISSLENSAKLIKKR